MLCTKQKVLRRFWYATLPIHKLEDGPKPFTLLGESVVLFPDADGAPAVLRDRFCHRTAKLSKGWCSDGRIICGYHGWEYNRSGALVRIPQFSADQALPNARVQSFHCAERYGYAWLTLEEPLLRIHQFDDRWGCGALRMMENSFDNAHFSFVHHATFGQENRPKPEKYELIETDYGFHAETIVPINNPPQAHRVTGTSDPFRNDREEDCSTRELIDWDAAIIAEDRAILESTDPDAMVEVDREIEMHMPSDRPGLIMRKRLAALLAEHGEQEVPR
jgi:phenylpropionate dioxygenase-like ring-hydroxylating dioxygenase large terminal subunit